MALANLVMVCWYSLSICFISETISVFRDNSSFMTARCCWSSDLLLLHFLSRFFFMCPISFLLFVETCFESVAWPWLFFWWGASLLVLYGVSGRLIDSTSEDTSLTGCVQIWDINYRGRVHRSRISIWLACSDINNFKVCSVHAMLQACRCRTSTPNFTANIIESLHSFSTSTLLTRVDCSVVRFPYVLYFACYSFPC